MACSTFPSFLCVAASLCFFLARHVRLPPPRQTALESHVRAFAQQDRNNDGYLSEVQLQHALRKHPDRQRLKPFDSFPRSTSKGISFTNFLLHIHFDIDFSVMHSTTPKANSFFKNRKKKAPEPESKEDIEKAAFVRCACSRPVASPSSF